SHTVSLGSDQAEVKEKILSTYLKSGLCPPYFKDLSKSLDIDAKRAKDVLILLVEEGLIIKTKEELYFHAEVVNNLKKRLVDFLLTHGEMTTPQFKEMTGITRKYLIPLIEYFDSKNITIRIGDIRKLRSS
ncbi:MAG: SelB C-terminal domain-containing protein, partial [Proteobacteria bacterium]|nr:SelB C-terminal domain-containing protein [Pseudomonadota bacterium]